MKELIRHKLQHDFKRIKTSAKWVLFSIVSGLLVGGVGTLFYFGMYVVTLTRTKNPWLIFLLPVSGILIVGCYRLLRDEKDTGTNLVLSAIHSDEDLPLRMAPLIFISTLITHLFGGSAGREGAALQLGGSIGNGLGKLFRFDEKDKHIMIMCGMSAAFSALFGTPMAAAVFSMEVVSVGVMYYAALVPILCAGVSIIFCVMLHQSEHLYKKFFKNPYVRIFAGGCFVLILTLLVGNQNYNGTGINIIEQCIDGTVRPEAFFMKMLFTALTLGAGFKGGEIVPSFFTGAAFGCLFGNLSGFSPTLCTAVGMAAVFCGVTNCPITALLISFELFGYDGMPYFLLAVAFSYMLSGYYGLYSSQKIIYSKYKTNYINRKTH